MVEYFGSVIERSRSPLWAVLATLAFALTILLGNIDAQAQEKSEAAQGLEVDPQVAPKYVTGRELMSDEERAAMRQLMQAATTEEERTRLRAANHAKMQVRAQERGLILRHSPKHQSGANHRQHGDAGQRGRPQQPTAVTDADISAPQVWGSALNVVSVKHLYFSQQPDAIGIREAKAAGVEVIINLRGEEEMEWDEAGTVAHAGLAYYQVPISGEGASFDRESMQRITELVEMHHEQKIWLHCSSGNRASAWLAVHLAQDHDMSVDHSIALARKSGLTKPELETRVRTYLSSDVME